MPNVSSQLQGLLYAPTHGAGEVKRLREQVYAGNPAMQQALVRDDRYWHGRDVASQSPVAGAATLAASVPYDLMKAAYFHGPRPVRQGLEALTARLFPGEGFNMQTTSRPSWGATGALLQGIAEGTQLSIAQRLQALQK